MTQPNFLQVQSSLDRACAFVEAHPDLESSSRYGQSIAAMRERFLAATRATDARYTAWRQALGAELGRYQQIKTEYDRVVELADEHGYDDVPRRRIVYTESDQLFRLVGDSVAWLRKQGDEWPWMAERATHLERLVEESTARARAATALYQQYTVEVKRRVTAYDDAVALMREFLADAKRDGSEFDDFERIRIDVL